jgi:hypothetical protein
LPITAAKADEVNNNKDNASVAFMGLSGWMDR